METIKISLPTAFMLETLRANGVTDEQILKQINKKDVSPWQKIDTTFDFQELVNLATNSEKDFESIITDGYSVKFMTINGLKNLLRLKFNKIQDQDYQQTEKGITDLILTEQELATIKQMLSKNCILHVYGNKISIDFY
ncbi:hypothetical protein KHA93_22805 [Bacillus sp. FJAT-49732]|uniref:Uncharacterized protein n=1 Tax=Lederbergia citrisecunda TaxID=2833583 RepID=A0A942TT17_9BACI|nr:hypothetical protein [Lederbergia citrisecunda]MBS4202437.1 hypothetical protein [Lederbergia citrisecunda]